MQAIAGSRRPTVGYKFRPTDKELLVFFLYSKVSRIPLAPEYNTFIRDCDLYGGLEPWEIWELYRGVPVLRHGEEEEEEEEEQEEDMFFFTQLKRKTEKGSRISRTVGGGGGAWQGEDAAKRVPQETSERKLGSKKRFRYENKGSDQDGCWIMYEYSLDSSLLEPGHLNDFVVCRIRKNVNALKKIKHQERLLNAEDVNGSTAAGGGHHSQSPALCHANLIFS